MSIINERIKQRRLEIGLTLSEVADALGVKEATAQRYESGAIRTIGHDTICGLARVLHCSPSYLMGWDEKSASSDAFQLSSVEKEIILNFRALSDREQLLILRALDVKIN